MNQVPPFTAPSNPEAPKTSLAAIFSMIFGILSFCLSIFGTIPALILGIVALVKINGSQGQLKGKGFAITGIVTGGMGVFVSAIIMAIAMPAFVGVQEAARQNKQTNDVRILLVACQTFAAEHDGKYPDTLKELSPDFISDESLLGYINSDSGQIEPYMYFSGKTVNSEPRSLLIASPEVKNNRRVVGFCDTSVSAINDEEFHRLAELESAEE
ncbi:MAG: DUF4190 domain-containing protein [Verrucomicrobiota bacterium]